MSDIKYEDCQIIMFQKEKKEIENQTCVSMQQVYMEFRIMTTILVWLYAGFILLKCHVKYHVFL